MSFSNWHCQSRWIRDKMCIAYQNRIRNVLATSSVRHTSSENPSASCVTWIWRYCGIYGMAPPKIIAVAAAAFTKWETLRSNSSMIIQSIFDRSQLSSTVLFIYPKEFYWNCFPALSTLCFCLEMFILHVIRQYFTTLPIKSRLNRTFSLLLLFLFCTAFFYCVYNNKMEEIQFGQAEDITLFCLGC